MGSKSSRASLEDEPRPTRLSVAPWYEPSRLITLCLAGCPVAGVIRSYELQRGLIGLRAAAHWKDPREAARRDLRQLLGKPDCRLRDGPPREVRHLDHLLVGSVGDLRTTVPDVHRVVAAVDVDPGPAVRVRDPHPFAADDDERLPFFPKTHPIAVVHPEVFEGGVSYGLGLGAGGHGCPPNTTWKASLYDGASVLLRTGRDKESACAGPAFVDCLLRPW